MGPPCGHCGMDCKVKSGSKARALSRNQAPTVSPDPHNLVMYTGFPTEGRHLGPPGPHQGDKPDVT